jgi:hypothetical protein
MSRDEQPGRHGWVLFILHYGNKCYHGVRGHQRENAVCWRIAIKKGASTVENPEKLA